MDANDQVTARLQRILGGMISSFGQLAERSPSTLGRLKEFEKDSARRAYAISVLNDLIPDRPDERVWLEWLDGGKSPRVRLRAEKFHDTKDASSRTIRTAVHGRERAEERTKDARASLRTIQTALTEAEDDLREAERVESIEDGMAKGAALWAYLREIHEGAAAAFAMGPAWTLMRVASGYLQTDAAWEATLSEEELTDLNEHRQTRAARSVELLRWLDDFSGDPALELEVFDGLHGHLKKHADSLPDRLSRKPEDARTSIGSHARTTDVDQVLRGLARGPTL